jgi:putative endonuclease
MTNQAYTALYTGVTSDLLKRVYEHKDKVTDGFTKRYQVNKLVYYEIFSDPQNAITREKQIKDRARQKKIELIERMNPQWRDLAEEL